MRIVYLFTSFPVLSETFLQREIRAMRDLSVDIEIYSLHKGEKEFEGINVNCFNKLNLVKLFWQLPYRFYKHPKVITSVLANLWGRPMPSWINCGETLLGLAFAIINAGKFSREKPELFHAVWATMPASAAMLLKEFTGIPYSMGAHAYDIFRDGGDWLLPQKIQSCLLIHTTTEAAMRELIKRGADKKKISLIRRGLELFPEIKKTSSHGGPLRILSVGRLIEKKGYSFQLEIYKALKDAGIEFEAKIIGDGPLRKEISDEQNKLQLEKELSLLGKLEYLDVIEEYKWADVFIFTGTTALSGDRDGLPNVIPEAMANGVPVITTDIAGTTEAISHKKTGLIAEYKDIPAWMDAFRCIREDKALVNELSKNAKSWVEDKFDARKNAALLSKQMKSCVLNPKPA